MLLCSIHRDISDEEIQERSYNNVIQCVDIFLRSSVVPSLLHTCPSHSRHVRMHARTSASVIHTLAGKNPIKPEPTNPNPNPNQKGFSLSRALTQRTFFLPFVVSQVFLVL